jgi:hypothetical protein
MEDAFGLSPDGTACLSAEAFLPEYADGKWSSSTGSLLWDRLLNAFAPQIRARYAALRQTVLSEEALTGRIRLNNIETREVTGHPAGEDFAHSAPDLPDLPDNIFQHSCRKTANGKWKITWENLSGKDCSIFWKNGDSITIKPWELLTLDCAEESQD